jgi:hypothetical protein
MGMDGTGLCYRVGDIAMRDLAGAIGVSNPTITSLRSVIMGHPPVWLSLR